MKFLFDYKGKHIANEVNGQLHATTGKNIGHLISNYNFFIDLKGKYLGEIIYKNRFLNNSCQGVNYGVYGNLGNVGNYGNPGNYGSIETISGYSDIEIEMLK